MNPYQFRRHVVVPALESIQHHNLAAENLVMGTAAVESRFEWLKQLGNGPALGFFQMEPATHDDIWLNFLAYRDPLAARIRRAIQYNGGQPAASRMIWDMRYAAIMCRVHYLRVKGALPSADDAEELGRYWKRHYNTNLGAGSVEKFTQAYELTQ